MESVVSFGRSEMRSVSTFRRQLLPILIVWSSGQSAWEEDEKNTDDVEDEQVVQRVVGDLQRLDGQICLQIHLQTPTRQRDVFETRKRGEEREKLRQRPAHVVGGRVHRRDVHLLDEVEGLAEEHEATRRVQQAVEHVHVDVVENWLSAARHAYSAAPA